MFLPYRVLIVARVAYLGFTFSPVSFFMVFFDSGPETLIIATPDCPSIVDKANIVLVFMCSLNHKIHY